MRRLAPAFALVAALSLAGCGFTPLYAEPGVSRGLSEVAIVTPDTRLGFELRQALEDSLGVARTGQARYRLETQIEPSRIPLGRRVDDTVTRYQLTLIVRYALTPTAGGETLTDDVTVTTTYAAPDQAYAGIAAQRDGEERAVAEAARLIRLDLARLLAGLPEP